MKRLIIIVLAVGLLLTLGCGGGEKKMADTGIKVVATTGMIGDAVKKIACDKVSLQTLMGPGVDPHLYKATKGDLDRIDGADLIFYNGLFLEAKMVEILEQIGQTKPAVAIGDALDSTRLIFHKGAGAHPDPHIWFDIALWRDAIVNVASALMELDPGNHDIYVTRLSDYMDSLEALDTWVGQRIAEIPEDQRVMITAHDAFSYFGKAYGMEVRGLQGISTVAEAGLQDVTSLVDFLVERRIKAVFVESSVPRRTIEAVVEGCRSRGLEVMIGGELYSDAMGEGGTPEGTYLGMVRHNVNIIVEALK